MERGQDDSRRMRDEGGSDPKNIGAAESRSNGVAPARSGVLAAFRFVLRIGASRLLF